MATIVVKEGTVLPDRIAHDHYPTPRAFVARGFEVIERAVVDQGENPQLPAYFHPQDPSDWNPRILDPGAGDGVWGACAQCLWSPREVVGVELREVARPEGYDRWLVGDFLTLNTLSLVGGGDFDLVIGNPPYKHAEAFVRRSLDLVREGGFVSFLFYLTFLESRRRGNGLFSEFPPYLVSVCKERPPFTGKSNPNAACYVTWMKGFTGKTELEWV